MTTRQDLWLQHYESGMSPSAAAKAAGYQNSYAKIGARNLEKYGHRSEACAPSPACSEEKDSNRIAELSEITAFWTAILRDGTADLKDRLKVSELLAKTQGFAKSAEDETETNQEELTASGMSMEEKLALICSVRAGDWDAVLERNTDD